MGNSPDDWIDVMDADSLTDESGKDVLVDGTIIAVFRVDSQLYALDALCAHQGGPIAEGALGFDAEGAPCVTCPWHGWQYELATGIQCINRQPLQTVYPIREHEGRIQIKLNHG